MTESPDRTQAPAFHTLPAPQLLPVERVVMHETVECRVLSAGNQDVFKLEFLYPAGKWHEPQTRFGHLMGKMLLEGTQKLSSGELSENFDYFGAFPSITNGSHYLSVSVFGLTKDFESIASLLLECIYHSVFPEQELLTLQEQEVQKLLIEQEKNNYLARVHFFSSVFGKDHPYGRIPEAHFIQGASANALRKYHLTHVLHARPSIWLAGKISSKETSALQRLLEAYELGNQEFDHHPESPSFPEKEDITLEKKDAVQSSIRYGCRMPDRTHPDYRSLLLVNEIFGGYFGSRLMKNIREDKGYTYGIYSRLNSYLTSGYWVIGTDVKKENTQDTFKEIHHELDRLINEEVNREELDLVKNYFKGSFINELDTPFSQLEKQKIIWLYGLPEGYYDTLFEEIDDLTPQRIQALAATYLQPEKFTSVVVGERL